ncbi:hypothetical protein MK489_13425 [Myxococcota bacterium]|nr:hypothetical protein [Myxococcota bacterium]
MAPKAPSQEDDARHDGTGFASSNPMSQPEDSHANGHRLDSKELLDLERSASAREGESPLPLKDWLALAEAWRITRALRDNRGNRSATARSLGIGRRTLYTKMEKLGLNPESKS